VGVELTLAAVFRAGLRAGATMEMINQMTSVPPTQQPTVLMAVPFFHVTGCLSILIKVISDGGQLVTMRRWNVDEAVRLMVETKVNIIGGVPSILLAIMQNPNLPKDFVLDGASYGGAPPPGRMPSDVKARWPEIGLVTAWGMTETNAPHTANVGDDYVAKPKSCGPALPVAEIRIACPDTKRILGVGERGLIQTRGMNMMKGYLNDKAANEKAYDADGWFDTGDAGYLDDEGFLFIADRFKDIIIRGGENISSEEVENAIYLDDRVGEAAAVPVPDDLLGELVAVAVSLRPGAKATAEQIIAAAHSR
jgi:acyl-CoA synthetase (AMP-forming)/AMP-acid ligase II